MIVRATSMTPVFDHDDGFADFRRRSRRLRDQ